MSYDRDQLSAHRARAVAGTKAAAAELAEMGVEVMVIGLLAKGGFNLYSDVDILVTSCPRRLKYSIEGVVEDALCGMPFDVVYLDELPEWRLARFTDGACRAADLV